MYVPSGNVLKLRKIAYLYIYIYCTYYIIYFKYIRWYIYICIIYSNNIYIVHKFNIDDLPIKSLCSIAILNYQRIRILRWFFRPSQPSESTSWIQKNHGIFQLKQPSSDWATSLWKASFRIIQYHPKNIKNSRWEWWKILGTTLQSWHVMTMDLLLEWSGIHLTIKICWPMDVQRKLIG